MDRLGTIEQSSPIDQVSFLKWKPSYIDHGDGLESNYEAVTEEVESGLIYKYRKDTAYPQWDPENN